MILGNLWSWCKILCLSLKNCQLLIDLCQLFIFSVINLLLFLGLFKHLIENFFIDLRNRCFNDLFLLFKLLDFSFGLFLYLCFFLFQLYFFLNQFFHIGLFNFLSFQLLLNLFSILLDLLILLHSFFKLLFCLLLFLSNFLYLLFIFIYDRMIIM